MKVVVQRVSRAKVTVNDVITGSIRNGLLLLVGIHENDDETIMKWVANKLLKLRIFEDEQGKMNRSVTDIGGEVLVVSQFTLYGNVKKGTRPSFIEAAKPEAAEPLYDQMISYLEKKSGLNIESGEFGAMMNVELVNDGPVTIVVEKS
jgi:D-aminoacyl-tRNA deacylase